MTLNLPSAPRFGAEDLDRALAYAAAVHAAQVRKGGDTPYFSHPLLVASIAMEFGADLEQTQAALLHDVLEDGRGPAEEKRSSLRDAFGERVYRIVDLCTDSDGDRRPKPPWGPRKRAYLERLAGAPAEARLVAAADKLANVTTTLFDLRRCGDAVWERFAEGREKMIWYYRQCHEHLGAGPVDRGLRDLLAEFAARIAELDPVDTTLGSRR